MANGPNVFQMLLVVQPAVRKFVSASVVHILAARTLKSIYKLITVVNGGGGGAYRSAISLLRLLVG